MRPSSVLALVAGVIFAFFGEFDLGDFEVIVALVLLAAALFETLLFGAGRLCAGPPPFDLAVDLFPAKPLLALFESVSDVRLASDVSDFPLFSAKLPDANLLVIPDFSVLFNFVSCTLNRDSKTR